MRKLNLKKKRNILRRVYCAAASAKGSCLETKSSQTEVITGKWCFKYICVCLGWGGAMGRLQIGSDLGSDFGEPQMSGRESELHFTVM